MKTAKCALAVALGVVALVAPTAARADTIVKWTLSGSLGDSGTVGGSFLYDASTNTFSSIDIITTAGIKFGGATYTALNLGFTGINGPNGASFVTNPSLADFTGTPAFGFNTLNPLTDAGGTLLNVSIGEATCANAACSGFISLRSATSGTLNGVATVAPVPEPSSLLLLGTGLLGLAGAMRRKRLA